LKHPTQTLENAIDVLKFVFGRREKSEIHFSEYRAFLARFGPENLVMEKICSILKFQKNGYFIHFQKSTILYSKENILFFDDIEQNKFIFKRESGETRYGWNYPLFEDSRSLAMQSNENTSFLLYE
jgi:hypothetical protein